VVNKNAHPLKGRASLVVPPYLAVQNSEVSAGIIRAETRFARLPNSLATLADTALVCDVLRLDNGGASGTGYSMIIFTCTTPRSIRRILRYRAHTYPRLSDPLPARTRPDRCL